MKKVLILVLAVVLLAATAVYFLFLAPGKEPVEYESVYVPGDFFITNTKESSKMVKATIAVTVNADPGDKEFFEQLANYDHQIRNIILFALRSKTPQELLSDNIEAVLEAEIVPKLKERIGLDVFKGIIISDLVIQ